MGHGVVGRGSGGSIDLPATQESKVGREGTGDQVEPWLVWSDVPSVLVGEVAQSDEKGMDEKIIAVPVDSVDPQYERVNKLDDLPPSTLRQIEFFFKNYKSLEKNKKVEVSGYRDRDEAWRIYQESLQNYQVWNEE